MTPQARRLVWADEFDGDCLDPRKWACESGNGFFHGPQRQWIPGWGNEELQYYTALPANVRVAGGCLHITALREACGGLDFTSARLRTRGADGGTLFSQRYGRFEVRAKVPAGRGLWSAVWLLPEREAYGAWPASGEIDLLEVVGDRPDEVLGSLHFGSAWPQRSHVTHTHGFPPGQDATQFHDYALDWEPGVFRWSVDGQVWARQSAWWSCSRTEGGRGLAPRGDGDLNAAPAPFDQAFQILVNLAVGGRLPGPPSADTPFPASLVIDHIRVYAYDG
ncbi:MAG: Glucan endo,3-beta-glucosidase precursor [Pseudomonadota bacterium]|jgi:beta-glucanase (GH16 family)